MGGWWALAAIFLLQAHGWMLLVCSPALTWVRHLLHSRTPGTMSFHGPESENWASAAGRLESSGLLSYVGVQNMFRWSGLMRALLGQCCFAMPP